MDNESSFTMNSSTGFVGKARFESRVGFNAQIKKQEDKVLKRYLEIQRDLKDAMYEFGESL